MKHTSYVHAEGFFDQIQRIYFIKFLAVFVSLCIMFEQCFLILHMKIEIVRAKMLGSVFEGLYLLAKNFICNTDGKIAHITWAELHLSAKCN